MRILALVKQVPDSNATIKVLPDGRGIDSNGLKLLIDPFDEFGVELAVQLKEKRNDVSEVVALTLGPDKAAEALRVALAMGADGYLYFSGQSTENYRLIALIIFAIVVMASGMWLKRRLIAKYQGHLLSINHQST